MDLASLVLTKLFKLIQIGPTAISPSRSAPWVLICWKAYKLFTPEIYNLKLAYHFGIIFLLTVEFDNFQMLL